MIEDVVVEEELSEEELLEAIFNHFSIEEEIGVIIKFDGNNFYT